MFGEELDLPRVVRPSAYGLLADARGRLALVVTPQGAFLLGGGLEPGETAAEAVRREAREEGGLDVRLRGGWARHAVELVYARAEGAYFEKRSHFLRGDAALGASGRTEAGYTLRWVTAVEAVALLTPGSHRWAVEEWCQSGFAA